MESNYSEPIMTEEGLTVKQAAELLECSSKTIRNKIKSGEIIATLVNSPYGKQYAIPRSQFDIASTVVDVVQIPNTIKLKEFGAILSALLEEQNKKVLVEVTDMKNTIENLQSTNEKLLNRIERLEDQHFDKLDAKLNDLRERLEEKKEAKQNWFQRLLKK